MPLLAHQIDDIGLPPVISLRDIRIQSAIDSFAPLYLELCDMAGSRCLTDAVRSFTQSDLAYLIESFLDRKKLPAGARPFMGGPEDTTNLKARRNIVTWACNQTTNGGFEPWSNQLNKQRPDLKSMTMNSKLALFASHVWHRSRRLDFSWGAVSRNAYRGIEGSYRYHSGIAFENMMRSAARIAVSELNLDYEVSTKETKVTVDGKSAQIDIVLTGKDRQIYIPCKSSEIPSPTHSQTFRRDVGQSLIDINANVEDVLVAFGGYGWQGAIDTMGYASISVLDFSMRDAPALQEISDKMIDSGIFY